MIVDFDLGSADVDTPYDPRPTNRPRPQPRPEPRPNRPEQYQAAVGDRTQISCQIQNHDKRTSWRRQDGRPLPRNAFLSGGDIIIDPVEEDAAGVYECVVYEAEGEYPIVTADLVVVGKCLEALAQ